jgi:hypothetical protein
MYCIKNISGKLIRLWIIIAHTKSFCSSFLFFIA